MAITILAPLPQVVSSGQLHRPDDASLDSEGDIDMEDDARPAKRAMLSVKGIVTPGETVTDDPQWMRCSYQPQYRTFSFS